MSLGLRKTLLTLLLFLVIVALDFKPCVLGESASQENSKKNKIEKEKSRVVDGSEGGHAVLWNEPVDIDSLDLFYGPGGSEGAPDLTGKFIDVGADTKGT